MKGQLLVQSGIENGYVTAFRNRPLRRNKSFDERLSEIHPVEPSRQYKDLPEVVVIGYRTNNADTYYSNWLLLSGMFGGGGGTGSGGYYAPMDGGSGGGGSGVN